MTADYSRTCAGCECITEETFATNANKNGTCYRCDSPAAGPWRGRVIGLDRRLEPYIPAWCPKLNEERGKMEKAISKVTKRPYLETGKTYFFEKSDYCGGCFHIYAAKNNDSWIFNIFDPAEFERCFEVGGNG